MNKRHLKIQKIWPLFFIIILDCLIVSCLIFKNRYSLEFYIPSTWPTGWFSYSDNSLLLFLEISILALSGQNANSHNAQMYLSQLLYKFYWLILLLALLWLIRYSVLKIKNYMTLSRLDSIKKTITSKISLSNSLSYLYGVDNNSRYKIKSVISYKENDVIETYLYKDRLISKDKYKEERFVSFFGFIYLLLVPVCIFLHSFINIYELKALHIVFWMVIMTLWLVKYIISHKVIVKKSMIIKRIDSRGLINKFELIDELINKTLYVDMFRLRSYKIGKKIKIKQLNNGKIVLSRNYLPIYFIFLTFAMMLMYVDSNYNHIIPQEDDNYNIILSTYPIVIKNNFRTGPLDKTKIFMNNEIRKYEKLELCLDYQYNRPCDFKLEQYGFKENACVQF